MEEIETYWDLTMKDGTVIPVKPQHVLEIKRQMRESKHLITSDWTKNVSDIKSFEKTSRLVRPLNALQGGAEDLEEGAAKAFHTPVYDNEAVRAKWVKRQVSRREWIATYSKIPAYRELDGGGSFVIMAYRLPVHLIDDTKVSYLTNMEIDKLY